MVHALDGIKVIDTAINYAGPTISMYLADQGADVIKVERRLTGDTSRRSGNTPLITRFSHLVQSSVIGTPQTSALVNNDWRSFGLYDDIPRGRLMAGRFGQTAALVTAFITRASSSLRK